MTSEANIALRDSAIALLGEELQLSERLLTTLTAERDALECQDAAAIDAAAAEKDTLVDQLHAKDRARTQVCETQGFAPGSEQMQDVIESCGNDARLQAAWEQLLSLAAKCRSLNMTNGAVIRLRQQHFAASLAVLSGTEANLNTYGRHGETATRAEGRAIATA